MEIYIFLFVSILFLIKKKESLRIILFICLLLAMFRGYSVGTDVAGYTYNFDRMSWNPNSWNAHASFGWLYNILIMIIKDFTGNPMIAWGLSSCTYVYGVYRFLKKYDYVPHLSFFFFVAVGSYFQGYNIMRQCFALGLILLILSYKDFLSIENRSKKIDMSFLFLHFNKNRILYLFIYIILISIIAFGIHKVMLVLLILPLLSTSFVIKYSNKWTLSLIVVFSLILGFSDTIANLFITYSGVKQLQGAGMSYAMTQIQTGETAGYSTSKLILNTIFCVFLLFVNKKNKPNLFTLCFIIYICILNLLGNIVIEFVRIAEIFLALGVVFLGQTYYNSKISVRLIMLMYAIILYFNYITKNIGEIVPYTFDKNVLDYI